MAISFHVIVAPDIEALGSMSFLLPEEGGSIGRATSNSFSLPDETETISSVHALVRKEHSEYILEDISQSGVIVNGASQPVGYQNEILIRDGDLLDIGGYRLLVSCFDAQFSAAKPLETPLDSKVEDPFKNKLDVRDREVIDRSNLQSYSDPFKSEESTESPISSDEEIHISINEEQPDVDSQVEVDPFIKPNKSVIPDENKKDIDLTFDDIDPDPFKSQAQSSEFVFRDDNTFQEDNKMKEDQDSSSNMVEDRLSVVDNNEVLAFPQFIENSNNREFERVYSQDIDQPSNEQIKAQIEQALVRFIDDLSPDKLEYMFNDYQSGLFKVKKKDLWTLYSNYFERMMNSKEFRIKFWAYFHDK